jgi:hypothetical protein
MMVDHVRQLHSALEARDYSSLEMEMAAIEATDHVFSYPAAISRGLLHIFD